MNEHERHLGPRDLERFLDGDVGGPDRRNAESHLAACGACARERRRHEALRMDLARLPLPEPPAFLDARILAAVLPAPSERAVLLRLAARAYGVTAALVAAAGAYAFLVFGPEALLRLLYAGVTRGLVGVFDVLKTGVSAILGLARAAGRVLPVTDALGDTLNGLETAALALSPQVMLLVVLTMALATLVLVWAVTQPRERGVPHVCLSL
jgi:hypothetical protein